MGGGGAMNKPIPLAFLFVFACPQAHAAVWQPSSDHTQVAMAIGISPLSARPGFLHRLFGGSAGEGRH